MSTRAPQSTLWDTLRGALVTRTVAVVSDLGVPEALADGPRDVEDLAREAGADPDALHRMLRALASDGIFAEEEPGIVRNTDASELLRRRPGLRRRPAGKRAARREVARSPHARALRRP